MSLRPIFIVLSESYSDWEIAPLCGVGRAFYGADIRVTSVEGGPLQSAGGLSLVAPPRFAPPTSSVVVVCGSQRMEAESSPAFEAALKMALEQDCTVAGICGGTVPLARAGLLDATAHTSNAPGYLQELAPEYRGAGHYVDQPSALRAGNLITAPAPAPVSFACEVLQAAGLPKEATEELRGMLAREHVAASAQ